MMDWKERVTNASERVFPGISQQTEGIVSENAITSNLPLQMALYFNVVFTPVWIVILLVFVTDNFYCYTELYKFLTVTVISTTIPIELVRLYLGYEGNLRDKIPELAGFWMLSVLLQLPLQGILLCNPYFNMRIVEIVAQSLMFVFLIFQLVFGYQALKFTAANQAHLYRLTKLQKE